MATTRLEIAAICWVLMTTGGWTSQTPPAPVLAADDISARIGNSLDAQSVVAKVLTHAMANRSQREGGNQSRIPVRNQTWGRGKPCYAAQLTD
jgi:hypothetical protein